MEGGVTLINAFEVPDGEDDAFLAGWDGARATLAEQQGYLGTRLHRALGAAEFRFVNVARWSSPLMFARALGRPAFQAGGAAHPLPLPPRALPAAAMNVMALYDIHGNVDALDAVLAEADPDVVLVGGDAVPGPFAAATLDRLESLSVPVHWIRGNGEREVAEAVGAPTAAPDDLVALTAQLSAAELGDERSRALGALPLTLELDGVLFCHATPRRDDEMVTRISSPERWAEVLGGVTPGRLVVAGHTHQQDDRTVGAVRFLNAGSVGLPYEGDGAARWLWIADGEPELRRTEYDAAAAGARILAAGWPDERSVGGALTDPVDPMVVTRIFEDLARD